MVRSQYSLSWDYYKSNICTGFTSLQQNGEFVDMTVAADGYFVKVHQALLALASPYLKSLITSAPCQHPVIFLNNVSNKTLSYLLEYVYTGEVLVSADSLQEFMNTARSLHIRGLENADYGNTGCNTITTHDAENMGQMVLPMKAENIVINEPDIPTLSVQKVNDSSFDQYDESHNCDDPIDFTGSLESDEKHINTIEEVTKGKLDSKELSSKLQFSVSIRGALQIVLNRFIYNLCSTRKKSIKRWRCVDYRCHKCQAYVVTKGNIVLKRGNPHNHAFHDKKILGKIEKSMIFSALEDAKLKSGDQEASENQDQQLDDSSNDSDSCDKKTWFTGFV